MQRSGVMRLLLLLCALVGWGAATGLAKRCVLLGGSCATTPGSKPCCRPTKCVATTQGSSTVCM